MKKKIIILVGIEILVLMFYNTMVFGTDKCKVDLEIEPQIEEIEDEVEVAISIKDLTENIVSVGFTLDYDKSLFEIEDVQNVEGWSSLPVKDVFMVYTSNYQGVDKNSEIIKIKLKVKEKSENFNLGLKNIKVLGEDEVENEIEDINKNFKSSNPKINDEDDEILANNNETSSQDKAINNKWIYGVLAIVLILFIILIIKIAHNNKKSEM